MLHSQPDLDDNIVALLRCRPDDLVTRVLVDDLAAASRRAAALRLDAELVPRRSLRGTWQYLRARVCVTTHGLYGSRRRPGRHVVNLWHGEFGKLIGELAGEPRRHADWMPVSGGLSRLVRCAEFGLPPASVAIVGTPRQQLLSSPRTTTEGPVVVWAPTYRRTEQGRRRVDGSEGALDDGPTRPELLSVLAEHGATLWYRPHPADTAGVPSAGDDRVRSAANEALEPLGMTFYELLATADVLVTDYSSVWVDWLLTGRPAISYCPDLLEYRTGRGLVLEPHEAWFPGPVVTSMEQLVVELDRALGGRDEHLERREGLRAQLHAPHDAPPTAAIWSHVRTRARRVAR